MRRIWKAEESRRKEGADIIIEVRCPFCGERCEIDWVQPGAEGPLQGPELITTEGCSHFTGEWDVLADDKFEFAFEEEEDK